MSSVERGFVRIDEGLVHYRYAGKNNGALPLLLIHASPGSSRGLEPLISGLIEHRGGHVIAPDTLGNGDSVGPAKTVPDIAYFADATLRVLDALGIERADIYGTHTGARIACELAILAPDRVRRLILDGIGDYDAATQALFLERYAPEMMPDDYGRQFIWAFNFVRDQALHFPYFLRDPAHRLMTRAVPGAVELHDRTMEVLKSLTTYHKAYRAAFAYESSARLPLVRTATVLLSSADDLPSLRAQATGFASAMPDATVQSIAAGVPARVTTISQFLDS